MARFSLLALVGCAGSSDTDGLPSIAIVAPVDGATVCGTPLLVDLQIENFILVDPSEGTVPREGEGHVDVYLNGQTVDMTPDESFDIPVVEDGVWQLRVELVNADHTALLPYAGALAYVTVDSAACSTP